MGSSFAATDSNKKRKGSLPPANGPFVGYLRAFSEVFAEEYDGNSIFNCFNEGVTGLFFFTKTRNRPFTSLVRKTIKFEKP